MKIKIQEEYVDFLMLNEGQCFKSNGNYYIKTNSIKSNNFTLNAVNLDNGQFATIGDLTKVEFMDLVCTRA